MTWEIWQDSPEYGCDDNPSYKWYAQEYGSNGHSCVPALGPFETYPQAASVTGLEPVPALAASMVAAKPAEAPSASPASQETKLYHAPHPDALADQFDRNAAQAEVWADTESTKLRFAIRQAEAATWRNAARMIRQTAFKND